MPFLIYSLSQLAVFAQGLAARLHAGDCIALTGDLGSGKTTLTQQIGFAMGIIEPITSPTFNLLHTYASDNNLTVLHGDLYRLREFETDAFLEEWADRLSQTNTVGILEWADIAPTWQAMWTWHLHLTQVPGQAESRQIEMTGQRPADIAAMEAAWQHTA